MYINIYLKAPPLHVEMCQNPDDVLVMSCSVHSCEYMHPIIQVNTERLKWLGWAILSTSPTKQFRLCFQSFILSDLLVVTLFIIIIYLIYLIIFDKSYID